MIKNQHFKDEDIVLDSSSYENCVFKNCRVIYSGSVMPVLGDCSIIGVAYRFTDAAQRTLFLVQHIAGMTARGATAWKEVLDAIDGKYINEPSGILTEDDENETESMIRVFENLSRHPDHAMYVARIAASYTMMEYWLCQLFCWIIQCPPLHGAGPYYRLQNQARWSMIKSLLPHLHTDKECLKVNEDLQIAVNCGEIRNRYYHALWQDKDGKLYITKNLDIHYPRGTKELVTKSRIMNEAGVLETEISNTNHILEELATNRPLFIAPGSVKPSFVSKFLQRTGHPDPLADPKRPSKGEEPEPPQQS